MSFEVQEPCQRHTDKLQPGSPPLCHTWTLFFKEILLIMCPGMPPSVNSKEKVTCKTYKCLVVAFSNTKCFLSSFRGSAIRPVSEFFQSKLDIEINSHIMCELHGPCQPQVLLVICTVQCYTAKKLQLLGKNKKLSLLWYRLPHACTGKIIISW